MIYLQDAIDGWIGKERSRVILPITDPYVVHHGALGSFATVYVTGKDKETVAAKLVATDGIEVACRQRRRRQRFELPPDRMGDLVVVSTQARRARHERRTPRSFRPRRPAALPWRHLGADVPLLFNRKCVDVPGARGGCATSTSSTSH